MARVFVGMSGGVDSAVAAALLKREGNEVVGCFIKIWQPEFLECTWREDRLDAMRVAAALSIPFQEVDLSEEYKREVVDEMVADYARGITPNPDVLCNSSIKFGHFLRWALAEGADMIATGHYAQIRHTDIVGRYELLRGKDTNKDQSYFLWQLGQEELARSLFPIGNCWKAEVRSLAKKYGLPNADKPDSQGLCFVGEISLREFLSRYITLSPGPVLDMHGTVVGEHEGAVLYTLGQRHGFTTSTNDRSPQYVTSVDVQNNSVTASSRRNDAARENANCASISWIGEEPIVPLETHAQTRYREEPVIVRIAKEGERYVVAFAQPHVFAKGQSLVIYQGDKCLGGGRIGAP